MMTVTVVSNVTLTSIYDTAVPVLSRRGRDRAQRLPSTARIRTIERGAVEYCAHEAQKENHHHQMNPKSRSKSMGAKPKLAYASPKVTHRQETKVLSSNLSTAD